MRSDCACTVKATDPLADAEVFHYRTQLAVNVSCTQRTVITTCCGVPIWRIQRPFGVSVRDLRSACLPYNQTSIDLVEERGGGDDVVLVR